MAPGMAHHRTTWLLALALGVGCVAEDARPVTSSVLLRQPVISIPRPRAPQLAVTDVAWRDALHGWAVGKQGLLRRTTDGGRSWTPQDADTAMDLRRIVLVDGGRGWIVGDHGTILATTDDGATWHAQRSGTDDDLRDVSFVDATHGFAIGGATVHYTDDGGATWFRRSTGLDGARFDRVVFTSATDGWLTGSTSVHTTDGGVTWIEQPLPNPGA